MEDKEICSKCEDNYNEQKHQHNYEPEIPHEHQYGEPTFNQETKNIEKICLDCGNIYILNVQEQMEHLRKLLAERNQNIQEESSLNR